jgi:mevalonate kinase
MAASGTPTPHRQTVRASAPGKIILFGEHAVVYGQPALAVPVTQVQATATLTPHDEGPALPRPGPWAEQTWIDAVDIKRRYRLAAAGPADPLAKAVWLTLERTPAPVRPFTLSMQSNIPIASGLGSGAAVCTATVRALSAYLGLALSDADVSALVYQTEKLLHGTPSGIDNTVIAYGQPVYFIRGQAPVPFKVARPFGLVIGDTGLPSPTKIAVGDVRLAYEREPARYTQLFEAIGGIATQAYIFIETGQTGELGRLMNDNHARLQEMGVSSPELDRLVEAARQAGAHGAKLSGGGRGGNMMALVTLDTAAPVAAALVAGGAKRTIITEVK